MGAAANRSLEAITDLERCTTWVRALPLAIAHRPNPEHVAWVLDSSLAEPNRLLPA
jgi:hypothetical protein